MATGGAVEGVIAEKASCCVWHLIRQCCNAQKRGKNTPSNTVDAKTKVVVKNVNNITCCGSNGRNVNDKESYSVGGDEACQTGNSIHNCTVAETAV